MGPDEEERLESDASDGEEPMEVDGKPTQSDVPMETNSAVVESVSKDAASRGAERAAASKPAAVHSGLPHSKDELEALIKAIHNTVNNSVLPRLHKCLTAKVQHTHTHLFPLIRPSLRVDVCVDRCSAMRSTRQ